VSETPEKIDRCIDEGMAQLGELYDPVRINDPLCCPAVEKCIDLRTPVMTHARTELGLCRPAYPTPVKPTTPAAADFADLG